MLSPSKTLSFHFSHCHIYPSEQLMDQNMWGITLKKDELNILIANPMPAIVCFQESDMRQENSYHHPGYQSNAKSVNPLPEGWVNEEIITVERDNTLTHQYCLHPTSKWLPTVLTCKVLSSLWVIYTFLTKGGVKIYYLYSQNLPL